LHLWGLFSRNVLGMTIRIFGPDTSILVLL
jgi:hypothetical protein